MEKASDPLDSLFVKGDEVNREILRDVLLSYVRLDEKGRIFPLSPFFAQSNKNKLIILLLARKVIALKIGVNEAISPEELRKLCGMPAGSVRPTIRQLVDDGLADAEDSKYKIFSNAVQRCAALLATKKEDQADSVPLSDSISTGRTSMKSIIEDIARQGGVDEGKSARELFELVLQRRPGTNYNALYKVILDLVHTQVLARELKGGTWHYRRAK